jgi:hypothetical protein
MNEETKSYNEWAETDDGQSSLNARTLGIRSENDQFLRNRILKAYMAGHRAGLEKERKNVIVKLKAWLSD